MEFFDGHDPADHIRLPTGSCLHRPKLESRGVVGCGTCGNTVFLIGPSSLGVYCQKCVRRPRGEKVHGKFDMVKFEVMR